VLITGASIAFTISSKTARYTCDNFDRIIGAGRPGGSLAPGELKIAFQRGLCSLCRFRFVGVILWLPNILRCVCVHVDRFQFQHVDHDLYCVLCGVAETFNGICGCDLRDFGCAR
jgi:hypothetical protein